MRTYNDEQFHLLPPRIAAQPDGLEKEKATLKEFVTFGSRKVNESEAARAEYERIAASTANLAALKITAVDEHQRHAKSQYEEATLNLAFAHAEAAEGIERRQRMVGYFTNAIEFAERYHKPVAFLATLEADAELMAAHCSVAHQRAMVACIERFLASQPLLEAEGEVTFSANSGRSGSLILEAKDAYKAARDAAAAVTNERSRQVGLGIGIAFGGANSIR